MGLILPVESSEQIKRPKKNWGRCFLLANQASVTSALLPSWVHLKEQLGEQFRGIFSPQHGFYGTEQDNMIETPDSIHQPTGKPIFSLYTTQREPTDTALDQLDTIVIDLPIVGCRVYTYKYTIAACLRAAKRKNKHVVIFDRPNPLGGCVVSGRTLKKEVKSFVGEYPIPLRHGLSAAEAAAFFNREIGASMEIIPMERWQPDLEWDKQIDYWQYTSPNLPSIESVYTYPGTVILEATNLSEGRGTTLPFLLLGAPYITDTRKFLNRLNELYRNDGALVIQETEFQPQFQKWSGQVCRGFHLQIRNFKNLRPFAFALSFVRTAIELCPEFHWNTGPYEYEHEKKPIDMIVGAKDIDKAFESPDFDPEASFWQEGNTEFLDLSEDILIYPRSRRIE